MVVRKRRKKNKARGNRTHGAGGTKNRRGSGCRGGVGKAGSHKHKFSKYWVDFGVKRMFKARPKQPAVNLEYISEKIEDWVAAGKVKQENGMIIIDGKALGFGKVLGKGMVKEKLKLENATASKGAAQKIVAAGGTVPGDEGKEQAGEDIEFEAEEGEEGGEK